jgi:hypothetical protein
MNTVVSFSVTGIWKLLMAFDAFLIRHIFQPIVDAGYDSWCKRGKGFFVFSVVACGVISFIIPVIIDDTWFEVGKTLSMLVMAIIVTRFIILRAIYVVVVLYYRKDTKKIQNTVAKTILFALLKTIFLSGIFLGVFFSIGDIFFTLSLILFLGAVFFECCDSPSCEVIRQSSHLGA